MFDQILGPAVTKAVESIKPLFDELVSALDRHTEAMKEHTKALNDNRKV